MEDNLHSLPRRLIELRIEHADLDNLIDRATVGYVLDFVDVIFGTWHFWAFNVADAAITVGAVLFFADALFNHRHVSETA